LLIAAWVAEADAATIQFTRKLLANSSTPGAGLLYNPTSIAIGPDGKLYVSNQTGRIHIFTLDGAYNVTKVELINTIFFTPNQNADGSPANGEYGRLVMGLQFDPASTPEKPILYVAHSDPRIGYNNSSVAHAVDTHSGMVTRLIGPNFNANRTDLVTGLPRSRENHGPVGMSFGPDGWLYLSVGGNTNNGAPSAFFSDLPEYYLAAAVMRINVNSAGFTPIDVRHISSPSQELPGIFELFATGYRNTYDLVWHSNGSLYGVDNGANGGLGGTPGPAHGCADGQPVAQPNQWDHLHLISWHAYGGHPNPARGECIFNDGSIYSPAKAAHPNYTPPLIELEHGASTNGIAEYQSAAFNGAMAGNLIAATYAGDENIRRFALSPDGFAVVGVYTLGKFDQPLDVAVDFSGAIFVAEHGGSSISALIPESGGSEGPCPLPGHPDTTDSDGDGFTDTDEVKNQTDLCNGSSFPPDFDDDKVSDLLDADDDNDGLADAADQFFFDPSNGEDTRENLALEWNPGDQPYGYFHNTGFSGVQIASHGPRFNTVNVHVGAAGGFLSISTTGGTHLNAENNQENALQLGLKGTVAHRIHTRITEPFYGIEPRGNQAAALFLGTDEDNFVRLAVTADQGTGKPGIQFGLEAGGKFNPFIRGVEKPAIPLPGPKNIELILQTDPNTHSIAGYYDLDSEDDAAPVLVGKITAAEHPEVAKFFEAGIAAGVTATHAGTDEPLTFVFDYFRVERLDGTRPTRPDDGGSELSPRVKRTAKKKAESSMFGCSSAGPASLLLMLLPLGWLAVRKV
jgi:hypothetical protein